MPSIRITKTMAKRLINKFSPLKELPQEENHGENILLPYGSKVVKWKGKYYIFGYANDESDLKNPLFDVWR